MDYKAEHIDPEKFEQELREQRKYQLEIQRNTIEKAKAFYDGYTACLDNVSSMLHCSNYESTEKITNAFTKGANIAFYEICKELDVSCQDIREMDTGVDEKASLIAERIRALFAEQIRGENHG